MLGYCLGSLTEFYGALVTLYQHLWAEAMRLHRLMVLGGWEPHSPYWHHGRLMRLYAHMGSLPAVHWCFRRACLFASPTLHPCITFVPFLCISYLLPLCPFILNTAKAGSDLLTRGPNPGPASWLGTQVTLMVAMSATIWCLSPQVSPHMTHGLATGTPNW